MDATIEAAIIASVSTLAGTLGTQALSNRREQARQRADTNAGRVDEVRALFEEAAVTIGDALDILEHGHEPAEVLAAHGQALSSANSALALIDTKLGLRVPRIDQLASGWRLAFSSWQHAKHGLSRCTDLVAKASLHPEKTAELKEAVSNLRLQLSVLEDAVAFAFGARYDYGRLTFRERVSNWWETRPRTE